MIAVNGYMSALLMFMCRMVLDIDLQTAKVHCAEERGRHEDLYGAKPLSGDQTFALRLVIHTSETPFRDPPFCLPD